MSPTVHADFLEEAEDLGPSGFTHLVVAPQRHSAANVQHLRPLGQVKAVVTLGVPVKAGVGLFKQLPSDTIAPLR